MRRMGLLESVAVKIEGRFQLGEGRWGEADEWEAK